MDKVNYIETEPALPWPDSIGSWSQNLKYMDYQGEVPSKQKR